MIVKVSMRRKVVPGNALATALRGLPDAQIREIRDYDDHARIVVDVLGRPYEFLVVWVGSGWPSEVNEVLAHWPSDPPQNLVLTGKRFSSGALRILEEARVNWADEAGATRISLPPGLLIVREPSRQAESPPQKTRWSRSSVEIAELILHEGTAELHTGQLANRTGWSASQVSKLLKMFDDSGWTEQRGGKSGRGARRALTAPGPMLDSWSSHVANEPRPKRFGHTTTKDLLRFAHMHLGQRLGPDREDWALSTWAGLEMTTPYASTVPALHVYLSARRFDVEVDEVMRTCGIREVNEGARVEFWRADFRIFQQPGKPSGLPVISRPRLFADLLALGGRGADSAAHYRDIALEF